MMHRFVAFLLLSLYVPAALNATVTAHYCMGTLTGVDVTASAPAGNICGKCSMIKKDQKGCCHDKQETLKLNKDQLSAPVAAVTAPFVTVLQSLYFSISDTFSALRANELPVAHSPPLIAKSLLLLHCVFRI